MWTDWPRRGQSIVCVRGSGAGLPTPTCLSVGHPSPRFRAGPGQKTCTVRAEVGGDVRFGPAVSNLQKFSSGSLPLPRPRSFQGCLGNYQPHRGSKPRADNGSSEEQWRDPGWVGVWVGEGGWGERKLLILPVHLGGIDDVADGRARCRDLQFND